MLRLGFTQVYPELPSAAQRRPPCLPFNLLLAERAKRDQRCGLCALQRENAATRGFTGFQRTVGFGHVGQRKVLINANGDLAAQDYVKQLIRHFLRGFSRGHMAEQGLARHVE